MMKKKRTLKKTIEQMTMNTTKESSMANGLARFEKEERKRHQRTN